jgi:hypothetical protein
VNIRGEDNSVSTNKKTVTAAALLVSSLVLPSCGVGMIIFESKNGGPPAAPAADFKSYDIDCVDGFEKTGGQTAMGSEAGVYRVGCTRDGQPMTAKIVGVFHAAPLAAGKWSQYREEVTLKAREKGCPAVAVRKTAPTENQGGEAIGAFCVEG